VNMFRGNKPGARIAFLGAREEAPRPPRPRGDMPPAVTRARVPSGNIDSDAAWCVSRATLPPATLPPAGAVSELARRLPSSPTR
jgi:hypothetical protein